MSERFTRTESLLGAEALKKLAAARVAVFGLGGVGGYTVEALARSGVGALVLVDGDVVGKTDINRQILATEKTLGRYKADVAAERVAEINPACNVERRTVFFGPECANVFDFSGYDYVVDAIDSVTGKLEIIKSAKAAGKPVISCMGAGNKLEPALFKIADIEKTSVCPLAKVMRRELKKAGITGVKALYSEEKPVKPVGGESIKGGTRTAPGSVAFVPSVAGLMLAGEVVKDLIRQGR